MCFFKGIGTASVPCPLARWDRAAFILRLNTSEEDSLGLNRNTDE